MAKEKDEFFTILEQGVKDVLQHQDTTPADKIKAIAAGAELLQIKHKISNAPDKTKKPDNFFGKG